MLNSVDMFSTLLLGLLLCWLTAPGIAYEFSSIEVFPEPRESGLYESAPFMVVCSSNSVPLANETLRWLDEDKGWIASYSNGTITTRDSIVINLNNEVIFKVSFQPGPANTSQFILHSLQPQAGKTYKYKCEEPSSRALQATVNTEGFYRVWIDAMTSYNLPCPPVRDFLNPPYRSFLLQVTWHRNTEVVATWSNAIRSGPISTADFSLNFSQAAHSQSGNYTCTITYQQPGQAEASNSSSLTLVMIKGLPGPPSNVTVVSDTVGTTQALVRWASPLGQTEANSVEYYQVEYRRVTWSVAINRTVPKNTTQYLLTELLPSTDYQVLVTALNGVGATPANELLYFTTKTQVPLIPTFTPWDAGSKHIEIRWRPEPRKVPVSAFNVTWWRSDGTGPVHGKVLGAPSGLSMFSTSLEDLEVDTSYCCWVVVINEAGTSNTSGCNTVYTDYENPGPLQILEASMEANGALFLSFWLLDCDPWAPLTTVGPRCIDQLRVTVVPLNATNTFVYYIPFANVSQGPGNSSQVTVSLNIAQDTETHTVYSVTVEGQMFSLVEVTRNLTGPGSSVQIIAIDRASTTPLVSSPGTDEDNTQVIIIGCVVAAVVLISGTVVLVTYLVIRRRKKGSMVEEAENENFWIELNAPLLGDERKPFEENEYETVPIDAWAAHVALRHADSDFLFSNEYEAIGNFTSEAVLTSNHSNLPENKTKNRFGNVVAYDRTRVMLKSIPGVPHSDYINANYIDSYDKVREFIATQGPLADTVADFWRMVWEQNTSVIVMLAKTVENFKKKCEQYWPNASGLGTQAAGEFEREYGSISVRALGEEHATAYWTIRKFLVKNMRVKKKHQVERIVYQFHYLNWPDHGVPMFTLPVLSFVRAAMRANSSHSGPVVVHCSAGVGRTGTFIVLQSLMSQILQKRRLNVEAFVRHIRAMRNFMVQTEDQYIFIHDALLDFIESGGTTELMANKLHAFAEEMLAFDPNGETKIGKEYKSLTKWAPKDYLYTNARKAVNVPKNRSTVILPVDTDYRVKLTAIPGQDGSDYISASYFCGYYHSEDFIVTQHPLKDTVKDFWRMVWDQNTMTIVLLSNLGEEDMAPFWEPLNECKDWGGNVPFTLKFTAEDHSNYEYATRDFTLESKDDYELHTKMFSITHWPEAYEQQKVFDFVMTVDEWHKERRNQAGPIIVIDKLGGSVGATFCALTTLHQQLKEEGMVDVYSLAYLYHRMRPGVWQSEDAYTLLYSSITRHEVNEEDKLTSGEKGSTVAHRSATLAADRPTSQVPLSTFAKVRRVASINRSPEHRSSTP